MPAVPPYSSTTTAICSPDAAQLREQRVAVERLGHGRHRLHQPAQRHPVAFGRRHPEGLLDVHDAQHDVRVAVLHREPGEAGVPGPGHQVVDGVVGRPAISTRTRGVIRSSATRSVNRSERSSSAAVPASRVPRSALDRTSDDSSRGDRAERSSSAGSTPRRRTTAFAGAFRALISQRNACANPLCSHTTPRAVRSGSAIARFFGTSSPNTIDSVVATSSDRHRRGAVAAAVSGQPQRRRGPGRISAAIAGSAM